MHGILMAYWLHIKRKMGLFNNIESIQYLSFSPWEEHRKDEGKYSKSQISKSSEKITLQSIRFVPIEMRKN